MGRLLSPNGMEFVGVQVSIGGITDPSGIRRTYDDIEKILHQNKVEYKVHEESRPDGRFKSYSVSTS